MLRASAFAAGAGGVGLGMMEDELAIVGSGHGILDAVVGGGAAGAGADRGGGIVFVDCEGGR